MRGNTCTWDHVTRFRTPLRLKLITMGGSCAWQGDLDTCCLVFLSESVAWTRLGYFSTNGTTFHLRVRVKCMHHTNHDWLELWKANDYLLSVCWTNGCLCMIMAFVNIFLLIMVIWFFLLISFIINSPLQFLYCVAGTCYDHEPSFVGADGQQ